MLPNEQVKLKSLKGETHFSMKTYNYHGSSFSNLISRDN